MTIEYYKILKQAWAIAKANKFLWAFGLFLFCGNLLFFSFQLGSETPEPPSNASPYPANAWLDTHPQAVIWIFGAIVILLGILIYLYFLSKAGSIAAIKAIIEKQETSLRKGFTAGRMFFSRLLAVSALTLITMGVLTMVINAPVAYLDSIGASTRALILAVLGMCVLIPMQVAALLVSVLAPMYIVIFDLTIGESIKASLNLMVKYWRQLLLLGIFWLAVIFVATAVTAALLIPFVILAVFAYDKLGFGLGSTAEGLITAIAIFGFLFVQSVLAVMQQAAWVIVFGDIVKTERLGEEAVVASEPAA